jgi:hypothetical protein
VSGKPGMSIEKVLEIYRRRAAQDDSDGTTE